MELSLYRIKITRDAQIDSFEGSLTPPQLLRRMMAEKPTSKGAVVSRWHVGNVVDIDKSGLYFRLGRTSRSTLPLLNRESGDFIDQPTESAPYTHGFLDIDSEVCALAVKSALAATTDGMARQFQRLLSGTVTAGESRVSVSIAPITEPEQLLEALRSAYAITSFTISFTRPNPQDANELYIKPMQRLAAAAGGTGGQTTVRGVDLNAEPLSELVRSAAATGDNAVARVRTEKGKKPVKRSLRGHNARLSSEADPSSEEGQRTIVNELRKRHARIRGSSRKDST